MVATQQPGRRAADAQAERFEKARLQLSRMHGGSGAGLQQMWLAVAQLAADTLDVERVGVWQLMDEDRVIRCRYLLQRSNSEVFQGAVLRQQDFPVYFQALTEHRCMAADDAQGSPLSKELLKSYLQPLGITSMLDAPLFIAGDLVGVVCHEHIGPQRCWSETEIDFVESLERGRQLTNDVMNFGKDEAVAPRVLDVREVLDNMADMLRVLLGSRVTLHIDTATPVSRVFIDASQLERMILNLALNARDAMPEGGELTITVAGARQDDAAGETANFVTICVRDTGVGMDAATLEHIFEPFFTTKGDGGTGLGLVIVQQVVARAGGFIRMFSEPGKGTTARVHLPPIAAAR